MFEWTNREMWLDVSINAIPLVILAYFVVLFALQSPWRGPLLVDALTFTLTVFPLVLLVLVTYYTARAVERDAQARDDQG